MAVGAGSGGGGAGLLHSGSVCWKRERFFLRDKFLWLVLTLPLLRHLVSHHQLPLQGEIYTHTVFIWCLSLFSLSFFSASYTRTHTNTHKRSPIVFSCNIPCPWNLLRNLTLGGDIDRPFSFKLVARMINNRTDSFPESASLPTDINISFAAVVQLSVTSGCRLRALWC